MDTCKSRPLIRLGDRTYSAAELGGVPPVREHIDVLTRPIDELVSLEGVTPGQRGAVFGQHA
jgi:hypothetical protein